MGILKAVLKLVVVFGVGTVVGSAVKTVTPDTVKGITKVATALGGLVLTGIATDAACKYVDKAVDEAGPQEEEADGREEPETTQ